MSLTLIIVGLLLAVFAIQGWYRNRDGKFDGVPPHLDSIEKWKGTDNDTWWARWTLRFTGWQAFGPWSKYSWAQWKFPPREIFKVGGKGEWRYEIIDGRPIFRVPTSYRVLSRCQYYKRWHFAVLWPLQIQFHIYWRAADVPVVGQSWRNEFSIKQLLFGYGPIHWDADLIYWVLSFYIGGQFK